MRKEQLSALSAVTIAQTECVAPLRIVHYLPEICLEDGGVVRAVLDWCSVFAQRGHRMDLVTCRGDDVPKDWLTKHAGLPQAHILQPMTRLNRMRQASVRQLADLLRQADVLHLHAPWLPGNRQLGALARRLGVPYVVSIHGMLDDWSMSQRAWKKTLFMSVAGRRFLRDAACIHCTAEGELSQARKRFDNPNTIVLPCLVDLAPFQNLPGPESAAALLPTERQIDRKLLFLSRLHEKKGVDILIRAAALMRDAGSNFTVMIAGTGDDAYVEELKALTKQLRLDDRIFFLGLVTGTLKVSVYQAADLFVLPTAQENFGLVLTEALACGTPVLTTKGTDIWPELQSAGGEIVERTPEAFAAAATKLLNDPADRAYRGVRGREWIFTNLAVESLSQKYESQYRKIGCVT